MYKGQCLLMTLTFMICKTSRVQIYREKPKYRNFTDIIEYHNFSRASQSLNMLEILQVSLQNEPSCNDMAIKIRKAWTE